MNILYLVVSSDKSAKGGHFRSLTEVAGNIELAGHKINILNFGKSPSPVLKGSFSKSVLSFIGCGLFTFPIALARILYYCRKVKPDIIHAFDFTSVFLAKLLKLLFGIPYLYNKCGGPNYKYMSYSDNIILFSRENYEYYKSNSYFRGANLWLVPNRARAVEQKYDLIQELTNELPNKGITIIRINRFSKYYLKTLFQTVELAAFLENKGIPGNVIILGTIQETEAHQLVEEYIKKLNVTNILLITEDKFTSNAACIIDVADFVVGTGRGFMEAALLGKIMLAPAIDNEMPVMVTTAVFEEVAYYNFSERFQLSNTLKEENLFNLVDVFSNEERRQKLRDEMQKIYIENFDINEGINKYLKAYSICLNSKHVNRVEKGILKDFRLFLLKMYQISFKS